MNERDEENANLYLPDSTRPETAPRCLSCGYNLFGSPSLQCPECGRAIIHREELSRARWQADANVADRRRERLQQLLATAGWACLGLGFLTCIVELLMGGGQMRLCIFGLGAPLLALSLALLPRVAITEELGRAYLLCIGLLWLALSILAPILS